MNIQAVIDDFLRRTSLYSVLDIRHIPEEESLFVERKVGHVPVVIDISADHDPESLIQHLKKVPAIY